MSKKSVLMSLLPLLLIVVSLEAAIVPYSPVAVPYFGGVESGHAVTKAIDGSFSSFSVLSTDMLNGSDSTTSPPYASETTGHMIFDMGEVLGLEGITLFVRNYARPLGPKDVDFFYFADGVPYNSDDIEGDSNLVLIDSHTFGGITSGSESFSWTSPINTQYIGMRVNSGYEAGPVSYNYQIAEVRFNVEEPIVYPNGPASPLDVPLVSGLLSGQPILNAIDGNLTTFSVMEDDTLTGFYGDTSPAYADAPVTGHIIFDMGDAASLTGAILTSRNHALLLGPQDVDFFYYADDNPFNNAVVDDIEGDSDIIRITEHTFSALNLNATEQVDWSTPITTRYIGMRVNSSYDNGLESSTYNSYKFQLAEMQFIVTGSTPVFPPGDANGDGKVDGSDVTILAGNWQVLEEATWSMGDFNGDGKVDGSDVTILASNWQHGVTTSAASVPEPSTIVILFGIVVSLTLIRRVKK